MTAAPYRQYFNWALMFILLASSALAASNALEHLLDPFQNLDLDSLYETHAAIIDLILYSVIFVGIAQVTLAKRFPGRGGKALVAGLGMAMALSLSISERAMNFNLRSFGPFAAAVFLFLLGAFLYQLIHQIGINRKASGAIVFIVVYFSLRSVTPSVFDWVEYRLPFVHGLVSIGLIGALWMGAASLWPGGGERFARSLNRSAKDASAQTLPLQKDFQHEAHFIKRRLARITDKEQKTTSIIRDELRSALKVLDDYQHAPQSWPTIAEKLRAITPQENTLDKGLKSLQALNARLERFELKSFQKLQAQYRKLPRKAQASFRKELLLEKAKIINTEKLRQLEAFASRHHQRLRQTLNQATTALLAGDFHEARASLKEAILEADAMHQLFEKMKELEKKLLYLTRRELKFIKTPS